MNTFNENTAITSAISTCALTDEIVTQAARILVIRSMPEMEKPSELRDLIRADLAKHVRVAAKQTPDVARKGYNCNDRGDSRYSAADTGPLHFVKPTGGIDLGRKLESQVQLALRSLKFNYKGDVAKWARASEANMFKPVKSEGNKQKGAASKATKADSTLANEVAEVIKTLGLSRAETLAWLATASSFKKAA